MLTGTAERSNAIEECYEFMLAYAAQGLPSDEGSPSGGRLREFLGRAGEALSGLAESCAAAVKEEGFERPERYRAFFAVLDRDASGSRPAIEPVLPPPPLTSHLSPPPTPSPPLPP